MARLQKHIAKAQCALNDVQEMVDHLQAKVNADQQGFKRKFASTKVLLRKDEWNTLEKSLDSALYLFSITQTQYLVAMSTFCTTFLQEQPRSTKIPGQSLIGNSDSFGVDEEKQNSIKRRKPSYAHSTVANVVAMPYSNSFFTRLPLWFWCQLQFPVLRSHSNLAQWIFVLNNSTKELSRVAVESEHIRSD
ncbi:Ankyrin repeat-containing protein [Colletotrichum graminicola]|nr:Ankyrin repeat-containing protein [Colletotrichum graminicola]